MMIETSETIERWNELQRTIRQRDALREALERIVRIDDKHGQPGQKPVAWTLHECGKIARAALAGGE